MKTAALVLLTSLLPTLWAEAKPPAKAGPARMKTTREVPSRPKSKLIDMSVPAAADPGAITSTELDGREVQFFLMAFEIGGLETWLGDQAKTRGEADKVRAVGDALQSTQQEENEMLAKLAKKKGVALAPTQGENAGQKEIKGRLAKLTGPEFDKAVMDQIATVTQQAVDSYNEATKSPDKDIKYFAEQILPMVNEKLVLAKKVAGKALPLGSKPGFRESAPVLPPVATEKSAPVAAIPAPPVKTAAAATPAAARSATSTPPPALPKPTPITHSATAAPAAAEKPAASTPPSSATPAARR